MSDNLFTIFRSRFPADLSKVFIARPDGSSLTYAELVDLSGRLANVLTALGVKPGDRVAAQVEKSAEALLLYLATLRAGAIFLPLNSAYTPGEVRYFLGDAEPALFVCGPAVSAEMQSACTRGRRAAGRDPRRQGGRQPDGQSPCGVAASSGDVDRTRDDLAAFLYTSGTTGRSKGAMLSHGNLASNAAGPAGSLAVHSGETGCCTRCRSSTPTACSWRPT